MDLSGRAKRLCIYLNEGDQVGYRPAALAILGLLKREDAAGATVLQGMEGFGASGVIHAPTRTGVGEKVPIVVEWIDVAERVERLLPRFKELVPDGLITLEDTEIVLYKPREARDLSTELTAADVMTRNIVVVSPTTTVSDVVEQLVGQVYRAVPVVEDGRPIGIITNSNLTGRGRLGVRLTLLNALDPEGRRAQLDQVDHGGKVARDVMTADPVTVLMTTPLPDIATLMTARLLKRLPVVDASGTIVGMVSRLDLLRAVVQGFQTRDALPRRRTGLSTTSPVSAIMRLDIPTVRVDDRLPKVFEAIVSTRLHRAVVVDSERRVMGIVTDAELLQRVTPALHPSATRSLMQRLTFVQPTPDDQHASALQAGDLMTDKLVIVSPETRLHEVIDLVVAGDHKLALVVDADQRLVGAVDRADILRGLLPPVQRMRPQADNPATEK